MDVTTQSKQDRVINEDELFVVQKIGSTESLNSRVKMKIPKV